MANLSVGAKCTRTLLLFLNIAFLLFGVAILAIGVYIKTNGNFSTISTASDMTHTLGGGTLDWIVKIIILVGVLTICLATFGCCGALGKSPVLLYSYALSLTTITLIEFAALIVFLKYRNDLWIKYDEAFYDVFQSAYRNDHMDIVHIIEKIEAEFQCCGANSFLDYMLIGFLVPSSCYPNTSPKLIPYGQGCAEAIVVWLQEKLPLVAAVLGGILFIEVFGIIGSIVLGASMSHSSNNEIYYRLE